MRKLVSAAAALAALLTMGCSGPGMGPGNGPGYGPGYGPGAMGPGPGMMGAGMGMGPGAMGPSYGPGMMMGAPGAMMGLERLDLTADQRQRIAQIQDEARQQHQAWTQAMHAPGGPMASTMAGDPLDEAATRRAYESMSQMHKAMFESHLQTRQRILAVLTPEQRAQLGHAWGGGRPGS